MNEELWVEIETTKSTDGIWAIKGKIDALIFSDIVSNKMSTGYFKLDNVYQTSMTYDEYGNREGEKLFKYGESDRFQAYLGTLYLKVENLVSLARIDGESDLNRFKTSNDKHLSVVLPLRS